jgi:signal transduction histidine kinase
MSIASHEFRSPLTLIGVTANMLRRYGKRLSDEKKVEHLEIIESSVEEMTDLLNNVLVFLKREADNFQLSPESIDVENFCQGIVEKFRIMSEETHTLVFSSISKPFQIAADPKLLQHIFSNLLSNAVKYSPEGSTIRFELSRKNEAVMFRIKDEGIGILEADQPHLFDAFHRGKNVEGIQGIGLGLSIVKQFVELHGGTISVESAMNKGTTFTVVIPFRD